QSKLLVGLRIRTNCIRRREDHSRKITRTAAREIDIRSNYGPSCRINQTLAIRLGPKVGRNRVEDKNPPSNPDRSLSCAAIAPYSNINISTLFWIPGSRLP